MTWKVPVSLEATPNPLDAESDLQALKRRSVHGAAATFAAQAIRFALQFGSQVALARLLAPADFGLAAMMTPVLSFVQIFNELGLSQATIQRPEITQRELSGLFWFNVGISFVLAALLALASPLVAAFYGQPRLTLICVAMASLLVLSGLSTQQIAVMNRRMRFADLARIDIASGAVAIPVGLAAAWQGLGPWSLILMQAANSLTILVMAWMLSGWQPSWPRRRSGIGSLLSFGGHVTGYNLMQYAGSNLDSVLIGKFGGTVMLGFYDRAMRLVSVPVWQISLPLARVAVSLLSRLHASPELYRRAFLQMLQALALVLVPAMVWIAMTSDVFVPLLFGPAWGGSAPIVTWLAVSSAFAPLSISSYWLFVSQGRAREQLFYVCAKTAISIIALIAGLRWGAIGVAQSYAVFAIIVHGSLLWGATRLGPVALPSVIRACYPIALGALAASAALDTVSRHAHDIAISAGGYVVGQAVLAYGVCGAVTLCFPGGLALLGNVWTLRSTFQQAKAVL